MDRTGTAISNANVEIRSMATGNSSSVATTREGYWVTSGLASGNYQITVSSPGFQMLRQNISYEAANPNAYRLTLDVGSAAETLTVESSRSTVLDLGLVGGKNKKEKGANAPQPAPPPPASANVFSLQQRVAGVLPVAVDVPRTGTSYRFVRPLVVNEETKLTFTYRTK
jgi:hypothetical protein